MVEKGGRDIKTEVLRHNSTVELKIQYDLKNTTLKVTGLVE